MSEIVRGDEVDKKMSTSAWAKEKGMSKPEVDSIMIERDCIMRGDDGWHLIDRGKHTGGEYDAIYNEFRQVEEVMSSPETI
jgi:hypothetical protein